MFIAINSRVEVTLKPPFPTLGAGPPVLRDGAVELRDRGRHARAVLELAPPLRAPRVDARDDRDDDDDDDGQPHRTRP